MHSSMRRPSLEPVDLERQQQNLFDLSILKLQQEQVRHGVEPRLLRFVLINNALRALQNHVMQLDIDGSLGFLDCDGSSPFLCNTFKDGGLSSTPLSPPTPVKVLKLDTFNDQSPLIASSPFQSTLLDDQQEEEDEGGGGGGGGGEKRMVNGLALVNQSCSGVRLGKHCLEDREESEEVGDREEGGASKPKKACRPGTLHVNGTKLNGLYSAVEPPSSSSSSSEEEESPTPSPIDFTKVDPTLYDYDTRTNLQLPEEKAVHVSKPVGQNGDVGYCSENRKTVSSVGSLQDGDSPPEFLDDIDHIVSLLMT